MSRAKLNGDRGNSVMDGSRTFDRNIQLEPMYMTKTKDVTLNTNDNAHG